MHLKLIPLVTLQNPSKNLSLREFRNKIVSNNSHHVVAAAALFRNRSRPGWRKNPTFPMNQ